MSVHNTFWLYLIAVDIPRPTKSKAGKTVRIISPHSASSDFEDEASINPPIPSEPFPTSPSLTRVTSHSSGDQQNYRDLSGPASDGGSAIGAQGSAYQEKPATTTSHSNFSSPSGVPANPFSKTLATLEKGVVTKVPQQHENGSKSSKAPYDVDDFKRLLLTGEKPSSVSTIDIAPAVTFQTQPIIGDSSSNTDASSASRQSLFESISGPLHESPRTSQETSISDDERQRLVGVSQPKPEKLKPSTPRHRHGKLVKANAPQTVSFEDPALSFDTTGYTDKVSRDQSIPLTLGSPGDNQEPLPNSPGSDPTNSEGIEPADINASPSLQKKNPPALPSRRHGQMRSKTFIADSGRSSPISEEVYANPTTLASSLPTNSSKPTPPAPRRSGALRQGSSSSIPTAASLASSSGSLVSSIKAPPPTPPTRSPSLNATKRLPQASFQASSPTMPPPPPPRRRGSSQSSYTPSRLSGDYRAMMGQRPRGDSGASSISQLQITPAESATEKTDVLADLTTLQREVDELRGKMR